MLFCKTKDELRYHYGVIRCGAALFDQIDKTEILAYRKDDYQWNVLVSDKEKAKRKYKNAIAFINDITDYSSIPFLEESELINYIGENELNAFLNEVKKQSLYEEKSDLKIVYTPLHGTGNIPVRRMLEGMDVTVVKEQELPDGNFSTVRSPNPEEKDALTIAIEKAKQIGADLVLGTDPDCDRVGIAVKDGNDYKLFTGNQTGALLVKFVLTMKKDTLNKKSTLVKTIVTSQLGANIGRKFGLQVEETLTGFKYIGELITNLEAEGKADDFVMGFEESYGYLAGTHARDKDAVVASMLICEMAAYYKTKNMNLVDVMNSLYDEYGYYANDVESYTFEGAAGMEKMAEIMDNLRQNSPKQIGGLDVTAVSDYESGTTVHTDGRTETIDLPKSNVIAFALTDGNKVIVRPSGTEPKIKAYITAIGSDRKSADDLAKVLVSAASEFMK